MKKLNLGCGFDYRPGWVNLDSNDSIKADIHHDLEKKLPFEDNPFDEVFAGQVIEHVYNVE